MRLEAKDRMMAWLSFYTHCRTHSRLIYLCTMRLDKGRRPMNQLAGSAPGRRSIDQMRDMLGPHKAIILDPDESSVRTLARLKTLPVAMITSSNFSDLSQKWRALRESNPSLQRERLSS